MKSNSKVWYLENFNLFEGLPPEKMMELDKSLSMNTLEKNAIIYFTDDPSDWIYFLKEGKIKLTKISSEGKEAITSILKPGDIFGELAITGESKREDTAVTMEDAVICKINKNSFEKLLLENPGLNLKITKIIGLKLQRVERNMESLLFKDSNSRIISFIKKYAEEYGKKIGEEIFIKTSLTHQDIANLTATSRQTVTTVLNKLKEKNIIDFERTKLIIRKPKEL